MPTDDKAQGVGTNPMPGPKGQFSAYWQGNPDPVTRFASFMVVARELHAYASSIAAEDPESSRTLKGLAGNFVKALHAQAANVTGV